MNNIKNLTNDQLYKEYQTARQNLLNAVEGTKEEQEADRLYTEIALEIGERNMDLKYYKLAEQKEANTSVKPNTIRKSIKTIISTLLISATILLASNPIPVFAEEVHDTLNGQYNAIVVNSYPEQDNLVVIQIGDNLYSFLADDDGWCVEDEMIVTMDNDNVIEAKPIVDLKYFYKLGSPSVIYTDDLKTDEDLRNYAIKFLKDNYNDTLDIPIEFNKVYNENCNETIYGMTTFEDGKATGIVIDSNLVYNNDSVQIERTLIHELLHLVLNQQGKGYQDGQADFENEVIKQGASSNNGNKGILHTHVKANILQ